jgi:hypothetical protein
VVQFRDPAVSMGTYLPGALLWSARIALAQNRYADAAATALEARGLYEKRARDPNVSADVGEASLELARAWQAQHDARWSGAIQQAITSLQAALGDGNPKTRAAAALLAADY